MGTIEITWELDQNGIDIFVSGLEKSPVKGTGGKRKEDHVFFSVSDEGIPHSDHIVFAAILCFFPFIPNDSTIVCKEGISEELAKSLKHEKLLGRRLDIGPTTVSQYIPLHEIPVHSVGGGFDSLAARILYPEFSGFHLKPTLRNVQKMESRIDPSVEIISSNLFYVQERSSMPHFAAMLSGAMISASIMGKTGIITGSNANGIFLDNGNRFRGQNLNLWYRVFNAIRMPVIPVVSGFSRLATALLSHKAGRIDEAVWCGIGHGNCGGCLKCLRSETSTYLMGASGRPDFDGYFSSEKLTSQITSENSGYKIELRYMLHSAGVELPDSISKVYQPVISSDLLWKINPKAYPGKYDFSIIGGSDSLLERIKNSGMSIMNEDEIMLFESLGGDLEQDMMSKFDDTYLDSVVRDENIYANHVELVYINDPITSGTENFEELVKGWDGLWPRMHVGDVQTLPDKKKMVSELNEGKIRSIYVSGKTGLDKLEQIIESCHKAIIFLPVYHNATKPYCEYVCSVLGLNKRVILYAPEDNSSRFTKKIREEEIWRISADRCDDINRSSGLIDKINMQLGEKEEF